MADINVAIDGLSACGKSTLARQLAHKLGYTYIDSGAMYRAVTLYLQQHSIPVDEPENVICALKDIRLRFENVDGRNTLFLNDLSVEDQIRSLKVSSQVSEVAAIPEVRRFLVAQQQQIGAQKRVVMDGRDIGTVVFPDAELKIFLRADFEERLSRRYEELGAKADDISSEDIAINLRHRDHIDSTRAENPLRKADDARVLDNTNLSPQEQLSIALEWAKEATST